MSILLLSAILFSQAGDTTQPVLTWEPQMPGWGDTVTILYHHTAPQAQFKGLTPLWIKFTEGGRYEWKTRKMEREGGISTVGFAVPESVLTITVGVHTVETIDWQAYKSIPVAAPEGWFSIAEKLAELRSLFLAIDMGRISKEEAQRVLDSLRANPQDDPGYRSICLYGFLKLDEPDSAWAILQYMQKKDAGTPQYSSALSSFAYELSSGKVDLSTQKKDRLNHWIDQELLESGSFSTSLLSFAASRWGKDSTHLSAGEQGKILQKFIENNPYDLYVRDMLVGYYLRAGDTAAAKEEIAKTLQLNLSNAPQKEGEYFHTKSSDRILSSLMLEQGRLHAAQGGFDEALADFSFVILLKDDNEGAAYFERAKVWQRLERYRRAEGSFVKALKAGYAHAEPALKGIYLLNHGKEGYDEYLTEKLKPSEDEELRMTKDFGFADLEGNPGRFFDYRGKIVVVNYWGLGCGPCKREIPWLNELVEEYTGTDVEFLAFSFDKAEAQKDYFKDHPFEYTNLIQDGPGIFQSIGLGSSPLPWHAVVDPEGRVRFTRIGGREDNSDMKLIIDQLLREQ
ncbi:hypothetical protein CEE36_02225 [candidate division TA06 bacterium B3_TA06]|uniref:Thioredoxin domain-containing protein n=1 Tax=candidate division TA06 bacterium B3_TA06 TaxID=2012487 RepID=A0A532V9U5_UNCT6|nr:MAG: hypothetical protein CEE36_02225 [candidate division TA06 bacterium B3_TA06]